ncbi:translocation/assembly module TamB domain-containing protein [bacterium]|nr:translocation/assembly module TamB domain-containing protein [bacterium]
MLSAGVVVTVVCGAVVLAVLFLTSASGENYLRAIIERQAGKALGLHVRIGTLETNLVSRVQVWNAEAVPLQGADKTALVTIPYARIDYRLWHILTGEFTLESILVDSLSVSVRRDSTGVYNLPETGGGPKPGSSGKPPAIHVRLGNVIVKNASVNYHDLMIPLAGNFRGISVSVQGVSEGHRFHVQAGSGEFVYRETPVTVDGLAIRGLLNDNELNIEHLSFQLPGIEVAGDAAVLFGDASPLLEGELRLRGNPDIFMEVFRNSIPSQLTPCTGMFDIGVGFQGPVKKPNISLKAGFTDVRAGDWSIRKGAVSGRVNADSIAVDEIALDMMGGSLSGNGLVLLDEKRSQHLTLSVKGARLADLWRRMYHEKSPFEGVISGKVETDGPLLAVEDLIVSAGVDIEKLTYRSVPVADISSDISIRNRRVTTELRQSDSVIKAVVTVGDSTLDGTFSAHIVNLEPLAGLVDIPDLQGSADVTGTVSGNIDNPDFTADLRGKTIRYKQYPVDDLSGSIARTRGRIAMNRIVMTGALTTVDSLRLPQYLSDMRGGVSYEAHLNGPIENLAGEINARLFRPGFERLQFDSGEVRLSVSDHSVHLHSLELERDSVLVRLTGDYKIDSTQGTLDLAFLKRLGNPSERGGTVPSVESAAGDIYKGFMPTGMMNVNFDLSRRDHMKVDARGEGLDMGDITKLYPGLPDLDGKAQFELAFEGDSAEPLASLDFFIDSPAYEQLSLDSVRGNLRISHGVLYADTLEAFVNKQRTWAHGEIGLVKSATGDYTVSGQSSVRCFAEGRNITVQLLKLILPPEVYFQGSSAYKLECDGLLEKPHIRGTLDIIDTELRLNPKTPPVKNIRIAASFRDSALFIDSADGIVNELPFSLQGTVVTGDWEHYRTQMNLTVSGFDVMNGSGTIWRDGLQLSMNVKDFDLSMLQAFTPGLEQLKGILVSTMHVEGLYADPVIGGTLTVHGLAFKPSMVREMFTQGNLQIRIENNSVFLDSLSILLNGGSIRAGGNMMYRKREIESLDLKASVNNLKINRPKEYILTIKSGQLTCSKQNENYLVDGTVILGESRLQYGFGPRDILSFAQKTERPPQESNPLAQRIRLNIQVQDSDNMWVDNNLARLRLHSELAFVGNLERPNVTGRLAVNDGYVLYLDRKFDVKRGIVDFVDPNRINPVVDISAQSTIKTYQTLEKIPYVVTLAINGPLDRAIVDLTSDPVLDKPDILSLLTLGATRDRLTSRKSGESDVSINDVLKERTEALSSRKISGYVSRRLGNIFGLEDISIEGNLFNIGKSSGPQLFASEKLSNRMRVTYTTMVGHTNEQSIRLDYLLSKYFSIEGQTDQSGRSGLDIKYRLRFK